MADEELDAVTVNATFNELNNATTAVPALVRAARREAKANGMRCSGKVRVELNAEVHPKEET